MIEKFGFMLEHLSACQSAYSLIKSTNELLAKTDRYDITFFYRNLTPLVSNPNCAVASLFECYAYKGRLVSLDLNSAVRSLDYLSTKRYFFPSDLEYTKSNNRQYEQLKDIYCNKKIPLIARSESYKSILELAWGSQVIGVSDFNVEEVIKIILDYENKQ